MKKTLSFVMSIILCISLVLPFGITAFAYAAPTAAINANNSSIALNGEVNVTVKYTTSDTDIGAVSANVTYDAAKLGYISSSGDIAVNGTGGQLTLSFYESGNIAAGSGKKSLTATIKFKAKAVGASAVSLTTTAITNLNIEPLTKPGVKTVNISVTEVQKSSNNNLKSVSIGVAAQNGVSLGRGTLTPAFNKNTTTYTLKVPYNTHSVSLTGNKEDPKATTKVGGAWASNADKWTRTITVTAENGTTKVYTFNIVREAKPNTPPPPPVSSDPVVSEPEIDENLQVIVDDKTYYINTVLSDNNKPSGFTASISTYNGVEIPVFVSADEKMKVALLTNGEKEDSLFIYNSEKINFTKVDYIDFGGKKYIPDDFTIYTDEYSEYVAAESEIFGKNINSFKVEETSEYLYFWAVNPEGVGAVYSYDTIEKTMQRANLTVNENTSSNDEIVGAPAVDPLSKGISPVTFAITVAILVAIILALIVVTFVALGKAKEAKYSHHHGHSHHSEKKEPEQEEIKESPSEKLFQKQLEEAKKRNDEADSISLFNDEDKFPVEEEKEESLTEEAPIEEVLDEEAEPHETESVEEKTEEADFDEKALEEMLFPNGIPEKAEEELKIFDDEEKSEE